VLVSLCAVCASTSVSANSIPANTSPSDCIPRDNHYQFLFVQGYDGALWSRTTTNNGTSWSNWCQIGGQVAPGTGPEGCGGQAVKTSL
jgi:hypothetical protein